MVNLLKKSDNILLLQVKKLNRILVNTRQLYNIIINIIINIIRESKNLRVNSLKKDIALDLSILNDIIFEFKAPSNIIVDANKELNNITTNIIAGSYNTTAYKLKDISNILDAPGELIVVDILNIIELDLMTLKYNIIDLDILKAKSKA